MIESGVHGIWGIYLDTDIISRFTLSCSPSWEFTCTECSCEAILCARIAKVITFFDEVEKIQNLK